MVNVWVTFTIFQEYDPNDLREYFRQSSGILQTIFRDVSEDLLGYSRQTSGMGVLWNVSRDTSNKLWWYSRRSSSNSGNYQRIIWRNPRSSPIKLQGFSGRSTPGLMKFKVLLQLLCLIYIWHFIFPFFITKFLFPPIFYYYFVALLKIKALCLPFIYLFFILPSS